MTEESKHSNEENRIQQIRHNLVDTAVNFLLNPSVITKPYEHKTAFLKKKGLSNAEISLAYDKFESDPRSKQIQQGNNASNTLPPLPPPVPVYRPVPFWSRLSQFSSSLIVLGVAIFGAHYVYKKYIEPLIFGEDEETKSDKVEKQLMDMTQSLFELQKHVSSLEESMSYQKEQIDKFVQNEVSEYYPTPVALRELKSEIASVKSLLLNRHQFPALPKVAPTIPHWQLPSNENSDDTSKQNGEVKGHQYLSEDKDAVLKEGHEFELTDNDISNQSDGTNDIISEAKSILHECSEEMSSELP